MSSVFFTCAGFSLGVTHDWPYYKLRIVSWTRGYNMALAHAGVALFSTTRLPHRERLFRWVGPVYTQTWGFYACEGSDIEINSLEGAKKVGRIGTYREDAKKQFLKQNGTYQRIVKQPLD